MPNLNYKLTALLSLSLIINLKSIAQTSIEGTWKGSSICQIKSSPCHNEQVVYHISKDTGINKFSVIENKIINGKEEYMGTILFTFDPQKKTFISMDEERNARWEFVKEGDQMKGKLVYKNQLFRVVHINKVN